VVHHVRGERDAVEQLASPIQRGGDGALVTQAAQGAGLVGDELDGDAGVRRGVCPALA